MPGEERGVGGNFGHTSLNELSRFDLERVEVGLPEFFIYLYQTNLKSCLCTSKVAQSSMETVHSSLILTSAERQSKSNQCQRQKDKISVMGQLKHNELFFWFTINHLKKNPTDINSPVLTLAHLVSNS